MCKFKKNMQCSIIGSFRKYYKNVIQVINLFERVGISVLSPKKSYVLDPEKEFVLLGSDDLSYTSVEIQLIAFHRILRSSFVYVYCPQGYIGRTTAYEIGRIVERKIPLFFSAIPKDLPIFLPSNVIWTPQEFSTFFLTHKTLPRCSGSDSTKFAQKLDEDLFAGKYYD